MPTGRDPEWLVRQGSRGSGESRQRLVHYLPGPTSLLSAELLVLSHVGCVLGELRPPADPHPPAEATHAFHVLAPAEPDLESSVAGERGEVETGRRIV